MTHPLPNDIPVIEPVNAGTSQVTANISNTSYENNPSSSHTVTLLKFESSQNPCPTCGRFDHPIQSVSKLSPVSQACFFIPDLLNLQSDKPKRRINKVARTMTDSDIMQQIKKKEEKLFDKTQKVGQKRGQKRNKSPNQAKENDDDEDDLDDNNDIDMADAANTSPKGIFYDSNMGRQYLSHAKQPLYIVTAQTGSISLLSTCYNNLPIWSHVTLQPICMTYVITPFPHTQM